MDEHWLLILSIQFDP